MGPGRLVTDFSRPRVLDTYRRAGSPRLASAVEIRAAVTRSEPAVAATHAGGSRSGEQLLQFLEKHHTTWTPETGAGIPSWRGLPLAIASLLDVNESIWADARDTEESSGSQRAFPTSGLYGRSAPPTTARQRWCRPRAPFARRPRWRGHSSGSAKPATSGTPRIVQLLQLGIFRRFCCQSGLSKNVLSPPPLPRPVPALVPDDLSISDACFPGPRVIVVPPQPST